MASITNELFGKSIVAQKPKIAIHSITGCAGCQLTIYFLEELPELLEHIDLVAAPMIKEENSKGPYDITFMEGSVVCEEDLERLKQIREKTKILVAFGTCACTGNVQTMKNIMDPLEVEKAVYKKRKHLKSITPTPLHTHVKIDYALSGCPPDKMEILRIIKDFLNGKKPAVYENPVCVECIKKENYCLLEQDKSCLGPVTRGGCDALCPSINHGCTGCHGLSEDCHLNPLEELLKKKGLTIKEMKNRMTKYASYQLIENEQKNNPEPHN